MSHRRENAVLVVGPGWVGDMVMAQSLFKTLKRHDPERAIDVVAPGWGQALLDRMPEVRQTLTLPVSHGEAGLRKRWRLGQALRSLRYRQAIVLPRSLKAALVPWFARIPHRTGYLGEQRYGLLNDIRRLDRTQTYRTVDRFVALAGGEKFGTGTIQPLPPPALTSTDAQQAQTREALGLGQKFGTGTIVALCPGAEYGPAKRWPAASFAALARHYQEQGAAVWLLGSAKDSGITDSIARDAPGAIDLAGRTTLSQAIDLLAASAVTVSNDSGLMHIAAATPTQTIALYGSSDPQYTPPLSEHAQIIYHHLECSPCFARECPLGHLNCLRGISPDEVIRVVDQAMPSIS